MFAAFDIETTGLPDKDNPDDSVGITCAALYLETGACQVFKPTRAMKGTPYPARMNAGDCQILARALCSFADHGWDIISWNGLKFDFRILAAGCQNQEWHRRIADLALSHIDMMFAFYCANGWYLKLVKATQAMGLGGKTEGVDGAKAVELWQGSLEDQELVAKYVAQDARITGQLYQRALQERRLSWINSKGGVSSWYLPDGIMPDVQESLRLPLPTWTKRKLTPREDFFAWTNKVLV